MRKLTVLAVLLTAGAANADIGVDACLILTDTIYRQVAAGARSGWRVAALPLRTNEPAVCSDTARAVSKGFTRAMAERNLYITWSSPERQRGDVCLSHDLSQCYPNQDPLVPLFSLYDAAFVVQQWQTVQATIRAAMPAGTASDVSRFDPVFVGVRLQRSLEREANTGRLLD